MKKLLLIPAILVTAILTVGGIAMAVSGPRHEAIPPFPTSTGSLSWQQWCDRWGDGEWQNDTLKAVSEGLTVKAVADDRTVESFKFEMAQLREAYDQRIERVFDDPDEAYGLCAEHVMANEPPSQGTNSDPEVPEVNVNPPCNSNWSWRPGFNRPRHNFNC